MKDYEFSLLISIFFFSSFTTKIFCIVFDNSKATFLISDIDKSLGDELEQYSAIFFCIFLCFFVYLLPKNKTFVASIRYDVLFLWCKGKTRKKMKNNFFSLLVFFLWFSSQKKAKHIKWNTNSFFVMATKNKIGLNQILFFFVSWFHFSVRFRRFKVILWKFFFR